MMSRVRCARLSTDVKATSKRRPCALSWRPARTASATPSSVRSTSRQPVNRFFRFHSLWPWRTSTRRRSLILLFPFSWVLEIGKSEHVGHGVEAGRLAARPQRRLDRTAGEQHAVFGLVGEFEPLGGSGKDDAVIAHHRAAAQRRKTDVAALARASDAVAPARGTL